MNQDFSKPTSTQIPANKESLRHKAGDAIERVGEKLKEMGAEKLGSKVYNAGNKLEHSGEKKQR